MIGMRNGEQPESYIYFKLGLRASQIEALPGVSQWTIGSNRDKGRSDDQPVSGILFWRKVHVLVSNLPAVHSVFF